MEDSAEPWRTAQQQAHHFLRRYQDPATRNQRDDFVQEAALAAWRWMDRTRGPVALGAVVRTIARRVRSRTLLQARRQREAEALRHLLTAGKGGAAGESHLPVAGRQVPVEWLVERLPQALARLRSFDRQLLDWARDGFCIAEIALRSGLPELAVRVRLHRSRQRIAKEIARIVRVAGDFDDV